LSSGTAASLKYISIYYIVYILFWKTNKKNASDGGDPFGDAMNSIRKYVVSTTLISAEAWRNSTLIGKDIVEAVRELKRQEGKNILTDGSGVLIRELARHGLIVEYDLHVYPVALGGSKRLFPEGKRLDLTLVESSPLPTGVVFLRYRPAGAAESG
jgi:dihydrofolate reductase